MISCILGSKDRDEKIKKMLDSVYINYENINVVPDIIIIDGGSSVDLISLLKNKPGVSLIEESGMHGVTRAYNRGFRLAKYKWVLWISDDMILMPDLFKNAIKRIQTASDKTILSVSLNNNDGKGWTRYKEMPPVALCTKKLLCSVDFWPEDYITYASDVDFCLRAIRNGANTIMSSELKINHHLDYSDEIHAQTHINVDTPRFVKIWASKVKNKSSDSYRIHPNIYVKANNKTLLISKIQNVWKNNSWCNIYVDDLFNMDYLKSMNVFVKTGTESFNLTV